jgi:hypothetical protein
LASLTLCLLQACTYSIHGYTHSIVLAAGKPSAEELSRIRTRKPAPPVLKVHLADGSVVPLWNTFTDQQVGAAAGLAGTALTTVDRANRTSSRCCCLKLSSCNSGAHVVSLAAARRLP